jgi:hypothetical protein
MLKLKGLQFYEAFCCSVAKKHNKRLIKSSYLSVYTTLTLHKGKDIISEICESRDHATQVSRTVSLEIAIKERKRKIVCIFTATLVKYVN